MHALQRAVSLGAHALELDVHQTADGHLVVCHDATLERTTPGNGRIADHTLDEIRQLDNAYWWSPGYEAIVGLEEGDYPMRGRYPSDTAFGIATLAEVLDAFPACFLNFDIKDTAPEVEPYETKLADVLRAYERRDDVIVASFHDDALTAFREAAPEIHTSFGIGESLAAFERLSNGLDVGPLPSQVALQIPPAYGKFRLTAPLVDRIHHAGLAVHIWTIDAPEEMHALLDYGVDGIMTDCPSVLTAVLNERGLGWSG